MRRIYTDLLFILSALIRRICVICVLLRGKNHQSAPKGTPSLGWTAKAQVLVPLGVVLG
jgi:hypothetical protein